MSPALYAFIILAALSLAGWAPFVVAGYLRRRRKRKLVDVWIDMHMLK
jgi:hypothetical protein